MPSKRDQTAPPTPPDDGSADESADPSLDELSYEQAREELIQVVHQLESGGAPLAESLELWERGERLAALCQQRLDGARAKVDAAASARSGGPNVAAE